MSALRVYREGLRVGIRDFRDFWSLRSWLFGWMLRVSTNAFAWVLLGRVLGSETRLHYLLVGNAVAAGASAALWGSNATTWSRYDGTHPLLIIAPTGLLPAVIGRTSVWMLNGIATSWLSFGLLVLAFGYRPSGAWAPLAGVGVVVICASTFSFSLFMGALLSNRVRFRNLALDIVGMGLMALCGAAVPTTFWPEPVQWLAQVLPMTHGLLAVRVLLYAGPWSEVLRQTVLELGVGCTWLAIALLTMTYLFNQGRADGTIELA